MIEPVVMAPGPASSHIGRCPCGDSAGSDEITDYWLWWPALPVPVRVLGFPVFLFFVTFLLFMCISFICIMRVPA